MSFAQNCLYRFVSAMNDKMVLDVSQNSKDYNKLIIYQWNNGSNQKFAIRAVGGGKFAIFCAKNNMVIAPEGQSPEGVRVIVSKGLKKSHEFWEFVPSHHPQLQGRKGYHIKGFSEKVLDICQQECKNEQPILQWKFHGHLNQIWLIQPV